jgi:hypothetical protein
MNMDYIHAAKVIADFLIADDSAYEAAPDVAMESAKSILTKLQSCGFRLTHEPMRAPEQTAPVPCRRDAKGELIWGTCDGCGEDIAPEFLAAATNTPPDYMPEDFRKRATVVLCELCRTEGDEE